MKHTLAAGRILRTLIQDGGSQDQSLVTDQIIAAATTPLVSFASVGEQQEDLTDIITELEQVAVRLVIVRRYCSCCSLRFVSRPFILSFSPQCFPFVFIRTLKS